MQEIKTYLRAASVKAVLVDEADVVNNTKASLTRGMQAEMILYLFHNEEQESAFTAADFANIVSWVWYADSDFDQTTTPKLIVNEGITVDDDGAIHIPILETNTAGIITYLGTAETKDLKCELAGFVAGDTRPNFILQWEFSIRNRIGAEGGGQPEPVADSNYTAAQVNALFAASNTVEYSVDGETWSAECPAGATQRRYKNSAISGATWTIESLAQGPAGTPGSNGSNGSNGKTYYAYKGYAADSSGTDFSISAAESRKWTAEFHSTEYIASPAYSHFVSAGAVWVKYIGDDGNGDMSTSDFVSAGGTGVVRSAAKADAAPWAGITDKPENFPPESHKHNFSEIADGARQTVFRAAAPTELYIDRHIIQKTQVVSNGVLTIDFSTIKTSSGGSAYAASAGDCFTWEYWIYATNDIISLNLGSSMTISALETNPLPEELTAIGSNSTLHAFAVRAFYKSGATQNLKITVNYLYSTEA